MLDVKSKNAIDYDEEEKIKFDFNVYDPVISYKIRHEI